MTSRTLPFVKAGTTRASFEMQSVKSLTLRPTMALIVLILCLLWNVTAIITSTYFITRAFYLQQQGQDIEQKSALQLIN